MKVNAIALAVFVSCIAGWVIAQDASPESSLASAEQRLSDLVLRAQRLQSEREIENLQRVYGYYLDRRMWDHLSDLFAEDGTIEIGMRGVYLGKRRIRESLELFGPQGLSHGELSDHANLQPVITVAPDNQTAKGRVHALLMLGTHGKSGSLGGGVYENEYVREDGVWKIASLRFYTTFATDYDQGWAKSAFPAPVASETNAPDRPPSTAYRNYPAYFVPPFHYPNPVTGRAVQYAEGRE